MKFERACVAVENADFSKSMLVFHLPKVLLTASAFGRTFVCRGESRVVAGSRYAPMVVACWGCLSVQSVTAKGQAA